MCSVNEHNYYNYGKIKASFYITLRSRGYIALVSLLKKRIRGHHVYMDREVENGMG